MTRTFDRLSRELRRRTLLMIGRAVLTVVNDATKLQTVQVEGLPGEIIDGAEKFGMYGITSHPLPGADALVLAVGGMRQHPIVMVDDRRYRVRELEEGEVCIYTDEDLLDAGQPTTMDEDQDATMPHRITLKRGRIVEIEGDRIAITADTRITLTVGGSTIVMTDSGVDIDGQRIDLN